MSPWNDLVQKIYNENKHKKGFKLKDAMKLASPIWEKSKKHATHAKSKTQKGGKKGGKKRARGTRKH